MSVRKKDAAFCRSLQGLQSCAREVDDLLRGYRKVSVTHKQILLIKPDYHKKCDSANVLAKQVRAK